MMTRFKFHWLMLIGVATLVLSGCTSMSDSSPAPEEGPVASEEQPVDERPAYERTTEDPDDIAYNLQRLADRDFIDTYGDGENEKIWYHAAENLGQIGKPAVPYLIEKLSSNDEYEVMLALYALQLATQDEQLQEQLNGNYVRFPSVLNPRANAHNVAIAQDWWREYRHIWQIR